MTYDYLKPTGQYLENEKEQYSSHKEYRTETNRPPHYTIIEKFSEELKKLNNEVSFLKTKIASLESKMFSDEEFVDIRRIPIEDLKIEMLNLTSDGKTRYADEIADELNVDIQDVITAFNDLNNEKKLFIDENTI